MFNAHDVKVTFTLAEPYPPDLAEFVTALRNVNQRTGIMNAYSPDNLKLITVIYLEDQIDESGIRAWLSDLGFSLEQ